jgi:diguanylate cyclase (GGDEF)-like protein
MRFRLLALMQFLAGLALLAFAAFPTPVTPRELDLVLGLGALALALASWLWLPRLPAWALHLSLAATTTMTALLVYGMPSDQGQVFASYGFVLVSAFAATFFVGRALALQLALAVIAWVLATALNPQLLTPLITLVVAVIIVGIGWSFAYVTGQARESADRTRGVWQSLIDPIVILEAVRDGAGRIIDLRYIDANPAAVATLRGGAGDVVGRTVLELLPRESGQPLFEALKGTFTDGHPVVLHSVPVEDPLLGETRLIDVRAFRAGADVALTWVDVTEQVRAQEELTRRARTDDLTGFLARRAGLEALAAALQEQRAAAAVGALLYCDLDGFKDVNDLHGHEAGDLVLRLVAERVRALVRDGDLTIRIGGDEFLIALVGPVTDAAAAEIAEKIHRQVTGTVDIAGEVVEVGLSIGVVVPRVGEGVDSLVARADAAMYEAKHTGRGRVVTA